MSDQGKVDRMLEDCGAVLERNGKHEVWALPNGNKFTRSSTPSDTFRAVENQMRDLRHALGVVDSSSKLEEGERRPKKIRSRQIVKSGSQMVKAMFDSGALNVDDLTNRIEAQRAQITKLLSANQKYKSQRQWLLQNQCYWCRFKHFWKRWWTGYSYEPLDED